MLVIILKLHMHDTIFPGMWAVIAKLPSNPKLEETNSSRRDFMIVPVTVNRGNDHLLGTIGWSRPIWRVILARV